MEENKKDINKMFEEMEIVDGAVERKRETKKKLNPLVFIGVSVLSLVAVVALAVLVILPRFNTTEFGPSIQDTSANPIEASKSVEYPVEVPEFTKGFYVEDDLKNQAHYDSIVKWARSTGIYDYSINLPSSANGYTSDHTKEKLEDGSHNWDYIAMTAEDFEVAVAVKIQRLIQPIYGGWYGLQTDSEVSYKELSKDYLNHLFADSWLEANVLNKTETDAYPILVDWDGGLFEGMEFPDNLGYAKLYGVVKETEGNRIKVTPTAQTEYIGDTSFKVVVPVEYYGFSKTAELNTMSATLELDLSISDNKFLSFPDRLQIVNAKLTIK